MTERQQVSRRWLYIPFIIAAIILAGYYLLWRTGAAEMKKAIGLWVEDQRAAGIAVEHGPVSVDGFPFFLRAHIETPDISAPGEWSWRAERLSLDALPYDLNKLILSPQGEQLLSATDAGEWRATANDLRASISRDKTRGWVFSMNIGDSMATRQSDGAATSLQKLVFDLAPSAEDPATLTLNLIGEGFEAELQGKTLSLASLQTSIALTGADLLDGPDPLTAWRAYDGELQIIGLNADIEDAKISIAGALRLDAAYYPAGALNAEIVNPAGLAALLEKTGALSAREAKQAGAGLTLAALANGGKLIAPVEFENGEARLAGVKIADVEPLR